MPLTPSISSSETRNLSLFFLCVGSSGTHQRSGSESMNSSAQQAWISELLHTAGEAWWTPSYNSSGWSRSLLTTWNDAWFGKNTWGQCHLLYTNLAQTKHGKSASISFHWLSVFWVLPGTYTAWKLLQYSSWSTPSETRHHFESRSSLRILTEYRQISCLASLCHRCSHAHPCKPQMDHISSVPVGQKHPSKSKS